MRARRFNGYTNPERLAALLRPPALPLRHVYFLGEGRADAVSIEPLNPAKAVIAAFQPLPALWLEKCVIAATSKASVPGVRACVTSSWCSCCGR